MKKILFVYFILLQGCMSLSEDYKANKGEVIALCEEIEKDAKTEGSKIGRTICYVEGFKLTLMCRAPFPFSIIAC